MWRGVANVVGVLALTGCASASGNHDGRGPAGPPPGPGSAVQAVAAALAFASHSDRQGGVMVRFVRDPAGGLAARAPGSLLLVATRPLLAGRRGTVMVLGCVPGPQQVLVTVQGDGQAWQATATGTGKR